MIDAGFDLLAERFADIPDKTSRRKMARQAARSVLPNATETRIFVTANARGWRHFIEMRCNEHAEVEIRKVAGAILRVLQAEAPNLFQHLLAPTGRVVDDRDRATDTERGAANKQSRA